MAKCYELDGLFIRQVDLQREINFEVLDREGYVCRLVPQLYGFELSPLDRALGNLRALPLIPQLSEFILHHYA
jgi:hypothetical protein